MIEKIKINNRASYDQVGIVLDQLKQVNFIYGTNGTGKTTLSNSIKNSEEFPDCKITWNRDIAIKKLVYNKEFVEENFHQKNNIKGIFTLGKESLDIQEKITSKASEITKLNDEMLKLKDNFIQKSIERNENEAEYEEKCWILKIKYDSDLEEAFKGYRAGKNKFKDKCKLESINADTSMIFEELKSLSSKIFRGTKQRIHTINYIEFKGTSTVINNPILNNRIIGQEDIDIANLITKLNISDWVKQGHIHMQMTEGICPFCQQNLNEVFKVKLDQYFNDSYNEQLKELEGFNYKYVTMVDEILNQIENVLKLENEFIHNENIITQKIIIFTKHESNKILIMKKMKEPSCSVTLEAIGEELQKISECINQANKNISNHNAIIDNFNFEKDKLITSIWTFIAAENKEDHKIYVEKDYRFEKAISGITSTINVKNAKILELILEVEELESQITSVTPSINGMNKLLQSFSFTNFKFLETSERGSYSIVRQDGEDAKQTLSEGEKTFVTFLYFIHLLNGSNDKSRITENKIVVIDDPISSLDSNILFIVSNLIRKIIEDIRTQKGTIQQVFILTHNIYFHKEVTFNKGKGSNKLKDETFWILRKNNNISEIQGFDCNPIKTSYELLWQEIQFAQERSSNTVQNLIRRIIENYFKIFGNYSEDDIINKFQDEEQIICRALLSWINDGSHFTNDDLYIECNNDTVIKYLSIFERIFEVTGHHAHFKMMMGIEDVA
ncbi:hypothetical protein EHS13_02150 [Paenibacillus psychroresistens]|uniref:Protein CR006 P-loop domain-containing protein n=1 Tax=Paenibacillus psychroresistens TaxID=1778678 RepID=A0A6B8RBH7_9BACL|nr:AAA family ATPase [Paenibacillus psychroresistens]QGQ93789.1 hypothetical protein EHS13_02150 [Paenibacillus psychroresistens]